MNITDYSRKCPQFYVEKIPESLYRVLRNKNWETLLDCGCGDGSLISAIRQNKVSQNKKIIGTDISKSRISLIKKIPNVTAIVDDAETMKKISSSSIDIFVSTQVIEHVDDKRMVKQIRRVLKSGGVAYVSTVFKKSYGWYFYRNNSKWVIDPTHLREYTNEDQLLDILRINDFKVILNKKTLLKFPITHVILRFFRVKDRYVYKNPALNALRRLQIPIPGYYNWEIIFKKK